jgi:energy-coupling factor transport system permease protein
VRPGALLVLAAGLIAAALSTRQPAVLAVLAVGAGLLVLRCPGPHIAPIVGAFGIALSFALINPFVAVEGNTVIFTGPHVPGGLIDLEMTVEEVVYGALSGLRLAIAILACAFLVLRADPDLLTGLASRVAPRSALLVALAARLVPTMRRDASALSDAARARGLVLQSGPRRTRARAASQLVAPLLASGLERGLETAEAMTARGYGSGPRTQLPARRAAGLERILWLPALGLVAVAVWLFTRTPTFRCYPTLGSASERGALLVALVAAALLACELVVVERCSPS